MVIGHEFAWGHIPKTGGCTTLALFKLFPELLVSTDPHDSNEKHSLFRAREAEISGKILVLTLRRLPDWTLDRAQHEAQEGVYPDYEPRPMRSPHQMAQSQMADGWIEYFTDHGRLQIAKWMRLEHLREDFLNLISEFTDVSEEKKRQIFQHPRVHESHYDQEIGHWFTEDQVRRMYENNPRWHELERQLYREWPRLE